MVRLLSRRSAETPDGPWRCASFFARMPLHVPLENARRSELHGELDVEGRDRLQRRSSGGERALHPRRQITRSVNAWHRRLASHRIGLDVLIERDTECTDELGRVREGRVYTGEARTCRRRLPVEV